MFFKAVSFTIAIGIGAYLLVAGAIPASAQTNSPPALSLSPLPVSDRYSPDYSAAPLQKWEEKFMAFQFRSLEENGHVLLYRIHCPTKIEPGVKYPLVLFFHGAGERGNDNRYQFYRFRDTIPFWDQNPCFVVAPQCPQKMGDQAKQGTWVETGFGDPSHTMKKQPTWPMQLAMDLLDKIIIENPIDTNRIYVTGLSMGGFATWEILQREPEDKFAAAMPVCGGADLAFASKIASLPIWVFHGSDDTTVLPKRSRDMVTALSAAGGHPKYTEYPHVGHGAWSPTYSNPEVWDWLFSQARNKASDISGKAGE